MTGVKNRATAGVHGTPECSIVAHLVLLAILRRVPDIIVRLDDTPLYGEPARLNVPLISVADTSMPLKEIDCA